MPITFYEDKRILKLDTDRSSFVLKILSENYLVPLFYGKKIPDAELTFFEYKGVFASFCPLNNKVKELTFSPDVAPIEYSGFGSGDFRKTAVAIRNSDGNNVTDFRYVSHTITSGKPDISPLPSLYENIPGECETLTVRMRDDVTGAEADLIYTVFDKYGAMTRSVKIYNASDKPMVIEKAYSASVALPDMKYDFIHLYGQWGNERTLEAVPLGHGHTSISSTRGSSSHHHNPFVALSTCGTDEEHGEVYGFNLVYSGNFDITADCDYYDTTRVNIGINPDGFSWHLAPGESFQTPEAVTVYSDGGLGEMSRSFHRLYSNNLIRGPWKTAKRPLLINSWEAAYFYFDTEKLVSFAERAKEMGIEMLVMDDGWFGTRNNDSTSLGDWYVNPEKFPNGLGDLIERVNKLGLKFGIWFEPEMISPNSELYKAHPDWALQVPGREILPARHQYVLDMSRKDVRDNIFDQIENILGNYKIDYVKWDFNRNISGAGSVLLSAEHGEEIFHRFVLGTYELMKRITDAHPDILLENCSGGGGRFDPAMLAFSPQIWASDSTSPMDRIPIQFGTSLCYPASTMGAHVSRSGDGDFELRGDVSLWGTFGYELDPNNLDEEQKETVKKQIAEYHKYERLIHTGDLYRLKSPWDRERYVAWEFVSEDRSEALLTLVSIEILWMHRVFVRLRGLDPEAYYKVTLNGVERKYSGALLMNAGVNLTGFIDKAQKSLKLYFTKVE